MQDTKAGAKVLGNAGIVTATQLLTKVCGAVFTITAARKLGVADYGLFVFAASFGAAFGMVVTFGLPRLITRSVARDHEHTGTTLGLVVVLEAALLAIMLLVMLTTLRLLGFTSHRMLIVGIAASGAMIVSLLDINAAFFRAHQRMDLEALVEIPLSATNMIAGLLILSAGFGILGLVLSQWAIFAVSVASGLFMIMRKLARPRFSAHWQSYRELLGFSWPFALSSILIYVYQSADIIFVSLLAGDRATGLLAGAENFVSVFSVLALGLGGAFLPVLSQVSKGPRAVWEDVLRRLLKYSIVIALPITVGLILVGDQLVQLVLGRQYQGSALILQLVALLIPLSFINSALSNGLISVNREKTQLRILVMVVVFGLVGYRTLIPRWGAYGGATAHVLAEGLMLASQVFVLMKDGQRPIAANIIVKPLLSVALMAGAVALARPFGLIPAILTGAVVYPLALIALRTFEEDERAMLQEVRRSAVAKPVAWVRRKLWEAA